MEPLSPTGDAVGPPPSANAARRVLAALVQEIAVPAVYREGDRIALNRAAEDLTGHAGCRIATVEDWFRELHGSDASRERSRYEAARSAGFPEPWTLELCRSDGRRCRVELCAHASHGAETWLLHDLTPHREVELELRSAKEQAEAFAASRSAFLANMSHEIRTPMTAILGFAEQLIDPKLAEDERFEAIHTILKNGEFLLSLINDILDFSKIDAGRLEIERIECSPSEIANTVRSLMDARAVEKRLSFEITCANPIPVKIWSDPVRIQQILVNLVGNAIKFTDEGSVLLLASFHGAERDGSESLDFIVMDSGIGMTPEQLARVFQPFTQADVSTVRMFGGTGLGLTISKQLALLLGGDLHVYSRKDFGTAFRLTIPTGPVAEIEMSDRFDVVPAAVDPLSAEAPVHARVLLAEDTVVNQRLIARVLERAGASVDVCADGRQAVDLALAAVGDGDPYDVVLMDMQMPVLDGYSATRLLRHRGYDRPVIALTANAMSTDRAKCLSAGCNDYATKPIDRHDLLTKIRTFSDATRG